MALVKLLPLLVALPVLAVPPTEAESRPSGTYRHCVIGCTEIRLYPSGRFELRRWGDLFSGVTTRGRFELLGSDLVLANSDDQPCEQTVFRELEGDGPYTILVSVAPGDPAPGATVLGECGAGSFNLVTDACGIVRPPCRPRTVMATLDGFQRCIHSISSVGSDTLEIQLEVHANEYVTDEKWLIRGGELYFLSGEPLVRVD